MLEFIKGLKGKVTPTAAIVSANDNPQIDDDIELPKPIVLINIRDDNTTRGDTKGRIGLGNTVGRKLGTTTVYADEETLRAAYPEMDGEDYETKLTKYLTDLGCTPDMILGFSCNETLRKLGRNPDDVVRYGDYNESLSITHLQEHELVAHHLTQEDLDAAGEEFDNHYPEIKKPIITIFLASQYGADVEDFSERLTEITRHYPEATIYICGGRRNELHVQQKTEKSLNEKLADKGQKGKVDVVSWEFSKDGYNPYKGLIARSDHFIVWGSSQSLVSEPLFTGKTVHIFNTYADGLVKKGFVANFNECDPEKPLQTRHFTPVNLTEDLAAKLIEDTSVKRENNARRFRDELRSRDIPTEWRRHLINIRFKPEAVKNVPEEYLEDHKFLKEAVKVSSFCLYFLPEEIKDKSAVAKLTIETNPDAFGMLSEKFRDDREFVESLDIPMIKMYPYLSEELRSDIDFVSTHLPQNTAIFTHLPEDLRDNETLARTAIFAHEHSASDYLRTCSDRLRDKKDFVRDVIEFSPKAYAAASDAVRSDIDIAKLAIGKSAILFQKVPQKLRDNKDLVRIVAEHAPHSIDYVSKTLAEDEDFILELIELNPEIVTVSSFVREYCSTNKNIMIVAIAQNKDLFLWADAELKHDPDFIKQCAKIGVNEAWENIGEGIADDEEFILEALEVNASCFQKASERVRGLRHIAEAAVQKDASMFIHASEELRADIGFAKLALNSGFTYAHFFQCSDTIKDNEDFVIECMQKDNDYRFFMHASPRVRGLEDVAITAIEADIAAIRSIHSNLYENPDFISLIVENYGDELRDRGYEIEHHTLWLKIGCCPDYNFEDIPSKYRNDYPFVRQLVDLKPELGENPNAKEVLERGPSQSNHDKYGLEHDKILCDTLYQQCLHQMKEEYYPKKEYFRSPSFNDYSGSLKNSFMAALDQSAFAQSNKKPNNPDEDFATNNGTLQVDRDVIAMAKKVLEDAGENFQPHEETEIDDWTEQTYIKQEIKELDWTRE